MKNKDFQKKSIKVGCMVSAANAEVRFDGPAFDPTDDFGPQNKEFHAWLKLGAPGASSVEQAREIEARVLQVMNNSR